MNYAVFFKAHKWDQVIHEQYLRLQKHVCGGDLFILYDNTEAEFPVCFLDNVININSNDMEKYGLVDARGFWYNGDYSSIIAFMRKPIYNFYVFVEYDVFVNASIDNIISRMEAEKIDIIGQKIEDDDWGPLADCLPYYENIHIEKSLFCIGFFSRRALVNIYARRLQQSERKEKEQLEAWPIGEAVMATEAKLSGLRYHDLSDFCDHLNYYDSNRALLASYAETLDVGRTFIHPVSDESKFERMNFGMIHRIDQKLMDQIIFTKNTKYYCCAYHLPENTNEDKLYIYNSYVENVGNKDFGYVGRKILSFGCSACQSSTSVYSVSSDESDRPLNLLPRYGYSIHTNAEQDAWWILDLGSIQYVDSVYLYDRKDIQGDRSLNMYLSAGQTLENIEVFYKKDDVDILWNKRILINDRVRYIKIGIEGYGMLHFDSCIVTGEDA